MLIPQYWAQARDQQRQHKRQVTVTRYGWSLVSQEEAQAMATQRVADAMQRILAGEKLERKEPRVAYNGADGMPIREEVLARHGEEVITRNAYGARCLNTPHALFVDVDYTQQDPLTKWLVLLYSACALVFGVYANWGWSVLGLVVVSWFAALASNALLWRLYVILSGGHYRLTVRRIKRFVAKHPHWNVRVYRTPAGCRLLATHQVFDARSAAVQAFFQAVAADPIYVRMCLNQQCFRARLTAKPWRIGIEKHMRPQPGVWPVAPERLPVRSAWVETYEASASAYAACAYAESIGSGHVDARIKPIVDLHDTESRALAQAAPLA